ASNSNQHVFLEQVVLPIAALAAGRLFLYFEPEGFISSLLPGLAGISPPSCRCWPGARQAWQPGGSAAANGRGDERRGTHSRPATSERHRVPALISGSSGSLPSVG